MSRISKSLAVRASLASWFVSSIAFADASAVTSSAPLSEERVSARPKTSDDIARDAKESVPIVAFTYNAQGVPAKSVGGHGYGLALAASGQESSVGGGVSAWASPVERLTLIADAPRDVYGRFTPSLAAIGRVLGEPQRGWVLGVLGKWKAEGFGVGPHGDEIESELEGGVLLSLNEGAWHFDSNAIVGGALGGSGEADAETRLRFGYDFGRLVRLGLDGQARLRIGGPKYLPNGRIWDFAVGSQVVVGNANFYGALTVGPSTMGVLSDAVGGTAILALGGTT